MLRTRITIIAHRFDFNMTGAIQHSLGISQEILHVVWNARELTTKNELAIEKILKVKIKTTAETAD